METKSQQLSPLRIRRLRLQGYCERREELGQLAFGIRFAYRVCLLLLLLSVPFANISILSIIMASAFLGVVLPNHPFDYVYNHFLAAPMEKPKLPQRKPQLKFACALATPWLGAIIYLFLNEQLIAGHCVGGVLIIAASLASFIDLCVPSLLYSILFKSTKKQIDNLIK